MGLFDMSSGGNMGFASVKNTRNFTNQDLLDKLSGITVSFGTPVMGDIKGTQSVMYRNVTPEYDVFCRVDKGNVIMGKIGAGGNNNTAALMNMGVGMLLGAKTQGSSTADHAVDELLSVIKKLENGEEVTASVQGGGANTATGQEIDLYMKQKLIAVKPKFDIFDQNENTVYHVEGDLARLNYSIQRNGTEVLKIKKKLVAIMPEFTITQGAAEVAKLKKKMKFSSPELNGTVNGKELKIQGDILGYDFDIQIGGQTIGHVDTAVTLWSDCYRIRIYDESLKDMVIALAIICDMVHNQENSN